MHFLVSLLLSQLLPRALCMNKLRDFLQVVFRNFDLEMYLLSLVHVSVVKFFKHFDLIKLYQQFKFLLVHFVFRAQKPLGLIPQLVSLDFKLFLKISQKLSFQTKIFLQKYYLFGVCNFILC